MHVPRVLHPSFQLVASVVPGQEESGASPADCGDLLQQAAFVGLKADGTAHVVGATSSAPPLVAVEDIEALRSLLPAHAK